MSSETYHAECVCGWSLDRDSRESNLPEENNAEIVRKVASIHEERPRFGEAADETHETTLSGTGGAADENVNGDRNE